MKKPRIVNDLFSPEQFKEIQTHCREIRKLFDWPGIAFHDENLPPDQKMNRWWYNDDPFITRIHRKSRLISLISEHFGCDMIPSYNFQSFYSEQGVVPLHNDRPQCVGTIDLLVDSNHQQKPWPIYVEDEPYILEPGQALIYSGTGQPHYRKPMKDDSDSTSVSLAFFHFVKASWFGGLR